MCCSLLGGTLQVTVACKYSDWVKPCNFHALCWDMKLSYSSWTTYSRVLRPISQEKSSCYVFRLPTQRKRHHVVCVIIQSKQELVFSQHVSHPPFGLRCVTSRFDGRSRLSTDPPPPSVTRCTGGGLSLRSALLDSKHRNDATDVIAYCMIPAIPFPSFPETSSAPRRGASERQYCRGAGSVSIRAAREFSRTAPRSRVKRHLPM